MGTDQQEAFDQLLESFVLRLKPEQVGREMDRIRRAGQDDLHFVWAGLAPDRRAALLPHRRARSR